MKPKKLYRSRTNRMVTGLAGGLASYFNMDPTVMRILMVALEVGSAGSLLIVYLIASLIVPLEPEETSTPKQ